jgi:large exoprotein involved in heme utilization and adhesion
LLLSEGARINTSTSGQGNAGNINLQAASIDVTGTSPDGELSSSGFFANVNETGMGHGGNIQIETGQLRLTDIAIISSSTFGEGNAGSISIFATNSVELADSGIFSNVGENAVGDGGNIDISTSSLNAINGGRISVSSLNGSRAGSINIQASVVELIGDGRFSSENGETIFPSGIFVTTNRIPDETSPNIEFSGSSVGSITLEADQLRILNGAQISTFSGDVGSSGSIDIRANNIEISGRGTRTITLFTGEPSTRGSQIVALASNGGNTGDISITTQRLIGQDGALISTQGGTIVIKASQSVDIGGKGTLITSNFRGEESDEFIDIIEAQIQQTIINQAQSLTSPFRTRIDIIRDIQSFRIEDIPSSSIINELSFKLVTNAFNNANFYEERVDIGGDIIIETGYFTLTNQAKLLPTLLTQQEGVILIFVLWVIQNWLFYNLKIVLLTLPENFLLMILSILTRQNQLKSKSLIRLH